MYFILPAAFPFIIQLMLQRRNLQSLFSLTSEKLNFI